MTFDLVQVVVLGSLLLTVGAFMRRATAALLRRDTLPSAQTRLAAHGRVAGSAHPAVRTAADSRSHAAAAVPAALGTHRFLALVPSPAGEAEARCLAVERFALSSVPAAFFTRHFVTVFPAKAGRTSALPRPETLSSVLTFGKTVGILAGLSLVAPHAEASVVPNADPRVFTRRLALRLRIENEGVRDSSGCVGARCARPRERGQKRQEEQGPPGAQTHELHGDTDEKTLLWR